MSIKSRSTFKTDVAGNFTTGSDSWSGQEVEDRLTDVGDNAVWIDGNLTMTTNTYDCTLGTLQSRALAANGTLAVTGGREGEFYTLVKTGAFTLTLPTGHWSTSGTTVPAGNYTVSFFYDGVKYHFSFAAESAT